MRKLIIFICIVTSFEVLAEKLISGEAETKARNFISAIINNSPAEALKHIELSDFEYHNRKSKPRHIKDDILFNKFFLNYSPGNLLKH